MSKETNILYDWKLKLGILAAIVIPSVTATGAFYDLKTQIISKEASANEKIKEVELETQRNFADKDTIKGMSQDIKEIRSEIEEVKRLIIRRSR